MPKLSVSQISDLTVRNSRPRERRYEIRDSLLRGFMLRVNPTGSKSWYIQLDRNHKQKIADASVLTVSVARYRAKDILIQQSLAGNGLSGNARRLTLKEFLNGRYKQFKMRQSRYGQRDIQRLCKALGSLSNERLGHLGISKVGIGQRRLGRGAGHTPCEIARTLFFLVRTIRLHQRRPDRIGKSARFG